jgi:hypothetical protein|tara:strand:- start:17 stop:172 length:156 start_codon:yes stop_codon:yes gene_type:complete
VVLDTDKKVVLIEQEVVDQAVAETLVQMEQITLVVVAVAMPLMVVMVVKEW